MIEYGWLDPMSGRKWLDGWQPIGGGLVRIRREVTEWEPIDDDRGDD